MPSELAALAAIGWKVLDRIRIAGGFAISPHGIGIALGYLGGAYVLIFEGKRRGLAEEALSSVVLWALAGVLVGSRLFYVIGHYNEFEDVGDMLAIYRGGISLLGGMAGGIFASYFVVRRHRVSFARGLDAFALAMPVGIVIGRIGDLIIGDHLGKPTSWLLAFQYHGGNLAGFVCRQNICRSDPLYGNFHETITTSRVVVESTDAARVTAIGVHQTALYDFLSTIVLVAVLLFFALKPRRTLVLFLTFVTWYGTMRIVTDFLRVDKRFFGLTGSQWTSVVAVAASALTLLYFAARPGRPPPEEAARAGPGGEPAAERAG